MVQRKLFFSSICSVHTKLIRCRLARCRSTGKGKDRKLHKQTGPANSLDPVHVPFHCVHLDLQISCPPWSQVFYWPKLMFKLMTNKLVAIVDEEKFRCKWKRIFHAFIWCSLVTEALGHYGSLENRCEYFGFPRR